MNNHIFDIIMTHEKEIQGQERKIDYSYFDFRPMGHQIKLDDFLKSQLAIEANPMETKENLEIKDVSRLDVLTVFDTLINVSEEKLEEMDGVQKIIDRIFDEFTSWYFLGSLFVYICFFIVPWLLGEFKMANLSSCLAICSMTMFFLVMIEVTLIFNEGFAYFKNALNWVDLLLIISWYLYCITIWN